MAIIQVESLQKNFQIQAQPSNILEKMKYFFSPQYHDVSAIKDLSFDIHSGERVAFIGPNGAGKSTTLKMLTGILYPTQGMISVLGYTPWKRDVN